METVPDSNPMSPALREAITQQLRGVFEDNKSSLPSDVATKIHNHLMSADVREEDKNADAEYSAAAEALVTERVLSKDELRQIIKDCEASF